MLAGVNALREKIIQYTNPRSLYFLIYMTLLSALSLLQNLIAADNALLGTEYSFFT